MTQPTTASGPSAALLVPVEFRFTGSALGCLVVQAGVLAISMLSFGMCFPWAFVRSCRWRARHTTVNGVPVEFTGTTHDLLGHCVIWLMLTVATFGVYAFWVPGRLTRWVVDNHRLLLPVPASPAPGR